MVIRVPQNVHLCHPKNRMSLFSRSQVRFPKKGHAFSEKRTCDFESIINPPFSRSKKVSFLAWQGTLSQVSSLNLRLSIRLSQLSASPSLIDYFFATWQVFKSGLLYRRYIVSV